MATLKMLTNDGNYIWLPNVKRVEQMFYLEGEENSEKFPWDIAKKSIERMKQSHPTLFEIVEQRLLLYDNKSALNRCAKNMQVLHVVLDGNYPEVKPQNWITQTGQNYLLENGKTVDRF